jgi:hypothetical protein
MRYRAIVLMMAVLIVGAVGEAQRSQTAPTVTDSRGYLADPTLSDAQNFSGVWQLETYSPTLRPVDGSALPFTKEGKQLFDNNTKDLKKADAAHRRCVPLGTPRAFISPCYRAPQENRTRSSQSEISPHRSWRWVLFELGSGSRLSV